MLNILVILLFVITIIFIVVNDNINEFFYSKPFDIIGPLGNKIGKCNTENNKSSCYINAEFEHQNFKEYKSEYLASESEES